MVRSTSSCFKIITCGSDSVDEDDIQRTESKGSTDKRQWSFRKRSPRHRVLSNTMISETPSNGNKESIDFYPQNNPTVPEKISANPLPTAANSGVLDPLIATENDCKIGTFISTQRDSKIDSSTTLENASKINPNLKENVATVIQSAIRGYLACRVLLKLKNVVKLQAVVRGHLVRRQAVGTLRCIQAIVKMQALVRAHRVEKALGDSVIKAKFDTKNEKNNQCVEPLGKEGPGTRPSAEKFLSNGFARQLLESTPKKEPIHIKCDPSRTDSAWKWLERWMSVSSSDVPQPQIRPENGEAADLKSCIRDAAMPLESEENLITYDVDNFDFQFSFPISSISDDDMKETRLEDLSLSKPRETSSNINVNQTEMQLSASPQTLLDSVSNDIEADKEQQKNTIKKAPNEQLEIDGKKFMFVPRKSCSPAFVAVQSKFEELSFAASSRKPIGSHQDEAELKLNTLSHPSDSLTTTKELSLTENLITYDPRFHLGGSECGTELSISSTLDSPDRSEVAFGELEDESKVVENASNIGNLHVDAKNNSSTSHPNSPYSVSVQQEQLEYVDGEAVDSDVVVDTTTNGQAHAPAPSPEASPQSHITAPESHGTPSSQTSVKAKRNKLNKSGQNRKSQSAGKESSLNRNHDSVVRHSIEQLPKDAKNGMRRNSFGSARSDHLDQEPRDSFSNSIPSYMQATESARAKANASNSPRSSPDLQDKEIYVKKRHSLPNANGKQGSSRKQPSISQVQHGASGKHTHSPREKWQR